MNFALGAVTPATGPFAGQRLYAGSHVLIVGVSQYKYLSKDHWLQFADRDARDLRDLLVRSYGFPPDSITLLLNEQATKANIEAALDGFADSVVGENDRVLIYFSGHGQTVPTTAGGEMGFLIPYDARVDLAKPQNKGGYLSTCLAMDSLWSRLGLSAARHALVIADACYGGLLVRSKALSGERPSERVIASLLARPARQVMTAGGAGETAQEDPSLGHGAFTYKLLEELRAQAATPDTVFTASELASSLKTSVGNLTNAHQTPVFGDYGGTEGDFLFVTTTPRETTAFAPGNGSLAATAPPQPTPVTSPPQTTFNENADIVCSASFSPSGKYMVTGSDDSDAVVWDAATGQKLHTLHGHNRSVCAASFSFDSKYIVTGSADDTARIWAVATGGERATLRGHSGPVLTASFSPDNQYVVTGSDDDTARIWNTGTGDAIRTLTGHRNAVTTASFSPDGRYVVTGSSDKTAKIWNAATGHEMLTLKGHTDLVYSAAFSRDGRRVVTGSRDKTARVWDVRSGQKILTLGGGNTDVRFVSFSPDGKYVVAIASGNVGSVWDAATGRPVHTLVGHSGPLLLPSFSGDGKYLATAISGRKTNVLIAPMQVASKGRISPHISRLTPAPARSAVLIVPVPAPADTASNRAVTLLAQGTDGSNSSPHNVAGIGNAHGYSTVKSVVDGNNGPTREHGVPAPKRVSSVGQMIESPAGKTYGARYVLPLAPAIPDSLKGQSFDTKVTVRVTFGADGQSKAAIIRSAGLGLEALDSALLSALRRIKFKCAYENGSPIDDSRDITFAFTNKG